MRKRTIAGGVVGMLFAATMVACSASASTASCAFVVGDGESGHDTKIHNIIYPGNQVNVDDGENVMYVSCNSRNYIINDGTVTNANGDKVGDRFKPSLAYTKTGVPVYVWTTAYWTLNQSDSAMRNFYTVCYKYTCGSDEDHGGDANFSTKGWNGMLGEDFGPSIDAVAAKDVFTLDDNIWQKHDPNLYGSLGTSMSGDFAKIVQAKTGFADDLFCGSGNSGWKDPSKTGKDGMFTCTQVRIVVDRVDRGPIDPTDNSAGVVKVNAQRLENAKAVYGDSAGYWLGLQDSIDKCRASQTACVFNIGGAQSNLQLPAVPK